MTTPAAPATDGRRSAAAARRRAREAEILAATRRLFDERGVRDAQIEDVAQAVGINRAIVYRHFASKEELFSLTLVSYLAELREALDEGQRSAQRAGGSARERLAAAVGAFVDYGVAHPAFSDCALALMRRNGPDLLDEVSESAMFRLGRAITACMAILIDILEQGNADGELHVDNPALLANTLYASGLGTLQLARLGILVTESSPGVPTVAPVSAEQVRDYLVTAALAVTR